MRLNNAMREKIAGAIVALLPKSDLPEQAKAYAMKEALRHMPAEVRKLYDKSPGWFRTYEWYGNNLMNIRYPSESSGGNVSINAELSQMDKLYKAHKDKVWNLRLELVATFASVKTTEQLLQEFPHFKPALEKLGNYGVTGVEPEKALTLNQKLADLGLPKEVKDAGKPVAKKAPAKRRQ